MNFAFSADKRQNFQPCPADNQLGFDRLQFGLAAVVERLSFGWTFNGNGLSVAIKQVLSTFHWNYLEEQIEYLAIDFIGLRFTEPNRAKVGLWGREMNVKRSCSSNQSDDFRLPFFIGCSPGTLWI